MACPEPNQEANRNLQYVIDHVFLPPKLPKKHDKDSNKLQHELSKIVLASAKTYASFLSPQERIQWGPILRMLTKIEAAYDSPALSDFQVKSCIDRMRNGGAYIANLLSTHTPNRMVFRCLRLSHPSAERGSRHA